MQTSSMQVFINAQRTHVVEVAEDATLAAIQGFISAAEGIAVSSQYLVSQGRLLEEGSLAAQGITNMSTINVCARLLGGKVHGSLARAGKVKGQTPKVDKQPKKKSQTGRAKRRIQYNRRFNVVVAPGAKKRSPNSNADKV
eukprot:m.200983 g.200983  ORF g.200983 m.200983 type:complete len:141 (+) comp53822_c1_seq2:535-957(+)